MHMPTDTGATVFEGPAAAFAGVVVLALLVAGLVFDARLLAWLRRHPAAWARRIARLRRRPWPAAAAAHVFVPLALVYVGATLAAQLLADHLALMCDTTRYLVTVAGTVLLHGWIAAVILRNARRRGLTWRQSFGSRAPASPSAPRTLVAALHGYIAMVPAVIAGAIVTQAILRATGRTPAPQDILSIFLLPDTPVWFRWAIGGMAVVTAPIAEELLFRGVLLPALLRRAHAVPAFLATALCFGLMHGHLTALTPLMAIGLSLSLAYAGTGTLVVPILMHALFNAVSLLFVCLVAL